MSRSAIRYAKALLSLAKDSNKTETLQQDMKLVSKTLEQSSDLEMLIVNPFIKDEQKLNTLKAVFKSVDPSTHQLFKVLLQNKRIDQLLGVSKEYIKLYDLSNNVQEAMVTTAVPLTGDLEQKIQEKVMQLTGNKASIINKVDTSIIGGFILRVGDLQYNASIAHKLTSLRRELSN